MYKLTLLLFLLLGWIQYSLWFGKNGVYDYISINNDIIFQQINNAKLKARNCQLLAEINELNKNSLMIEELARNELSMLKPDEVFYRLVVNN